MEFIEHEGISMNKLAKMTNTSSSQIHNIVNGKKYGTDKLINIMNALPDMNPLWLIEGRGEMKKNEYLNQYLNPYLIEEPGGEYLLKGQKNSAIFQESEVQGKQDASVPCDASALLRDMQHLQDLNRSLSRENQALRSESDALKEVIRMYREAADRASGATPPPPARKE